MGETLDVGGEIALIGGVAGEKTAFSEEVVPATIVGLAGRIVSVGAPHISSTFVELAGAAGVESLERVLSAAGVDDSTAKGDIPVKIINAKRANRADDGGRVLEDGGEAGDASLGNSLEDDLSGVETDLIPSAINAVRDLDAEGRGRVEFGVSDFFAGEARIELLGRLWVNRLGLGGSWTIFNVGDGGGRSGEEEMERIFKVE